MHQQSNDISSQQEGRINLALQAYTLSQFKSIQRAAAAFNVQHQRLSNRLNRIAFRPQI
jgi:hypothetical protein